MERVGIIGGGAWGTALAQVAAANGPDVLIWAREREIVADINERRENRHFLPGVTLAPSIRATPSLADLADRDILLLVTPAQFARDVLSQLAPSLRSEAPVVLCAKGIELDSGRLMSEVAGEILPRHPLAVLSGPTFASEVAQGLPTAVTLAAEDSTLAAALIHRLGRPSFRPYLSNDPVGAEVGGAVKNVLAIACGIVEGRRLGLNARAALITRGLAEMLRLGLALGGRRETMMGLSGLGDLVLTCTGEKSRNMTLGRAIGEGRALPDILAERRSVAEGVATAPAVVALAGRHGIEMPIAQAVDAILHRGEPIDEAIRHLLARPFRAETI